MTLLIAVVIRSDVSATDAITEYGYDLILKAVNVILVPGFMFIAAISGSLALLVLLREYVKKHHIARKWKRALNGKSGDESELLQALREDAAAARAEKLEKIAKEKRRIAKEKAKEDWQAAVKQRQDIEVDELQRVLLKLQCSYENTANVF